MGEHYIDDPHESLWKEHIVNLELFPAPYVNPKAIAVIKAADLLVLGPGDLYTSLLPNIVVAGIKEAIVKSRAKKVFVMNLMTRFGQTVGFKAKNFISELEKYLGKEVMDYCLINKTDFPKNVIDWYSQVDTGPVEDNIVDSGKLKIIRRDLVSKHFYQKLESDKLTRSVVRHDPDKLAKAVTSLI
ncbi:MAG: hypothetical protein ACD_52C00323G0014 [uncultured bacterium]|uniref:Gluconeogenesis factor n=1 Tax=Candidatus Woesebacteria bacterium RIFCSPHIGHO2_12_FULL_41_24 TaxID=1802510 RepID=A0A1F8AVH8_9BACT|nr:MAG: hypothetical protein ACD_52C00323G0014 [uncultured bacterium]OGM14844.1 MAG: hypothetical protein A2W15_00700 [Candidatus Woesebacteria bacterium RBG_16_41_13]OGM30336.1 MAG: hypothetical protein A2873_05405 [Candidatus Woesebacteria bacterium RIFCSPHIGHO2_01_FULL_42_80]OGM34375.1 MAG: hypothetical protein A3D84_04985 [Candidatus Woesebacteria bacterium RIFCSPHIGHO2_02_FULL_42_20]OGM55509.1 MAG: hypothetical protein A3E44_01140 [Candidatus Woesebacteria bacterium RIFCSPHIGHO2_12_FULL_41